MFDVAPQLYVFASILALLASFKAPSHPPDFIACSVMFPDSIASNEVSEWAWEKD